MNFTPNSSNPASLAGGRVQQQQQQQVHQLPATNAGNAQKPSGNLPSCFPPSQMVGNEIKMPPSSHLIIQQGNQNNNHNMGGIAQQININRSQSQHIQQQQQHMMVGGNQQNQSIFHQLQQMAYRQTHQTVKLPNQPQIKQQTIMSHQMKPNPMPQQAPQMKPVQPTTSQHNPTQFSPPKPMHPQMKTTAKLSSPGSQLQTTQKLPTAAPQPQPHPVGQVAALAASKNVPSSSPTTTVSPLKTQPIGSLVKASIPNVPQPVLSINMSPEAVKPAVAPAQVVPVVPQTAKLAAVEPAALKVSVEQPSLVLPVNESAAEIQEPKESTQIPSKIATKQGTEKDGETGQSTSEAENSSKIEKSAVAAVPSSTTVAKPAVVATTPSKNTMRLATFTPRQKKPPPTKKPSLATPSPKANSGALKSPAKSPPAAAAQNKLAEIPKTLTNSKKLAAASPGSELSDTQDSASSASAKAKRNRIKVQPYQSPTPELTLVTKLSTQFSNPNKNGDESKLTIFYKNEFLAVRNGEGSFYLCQAMQNVYKTSPKIRIRWLNEKDEGKVTADGARSYHLDFYDLTDFECVLTTVELDKVDSKVYELPKEELTRIENILKKAIDVESGVLPRPTVTEENPDGLDLSLYKDESQLEKSSSNKRGRNDDSEEDEIDDEDYDDRLKSKRKVKKSPQKEKKPVKKFVADDSTESEEENLMELKKKATKQAAANSKRLEAPELSPKAQSSTQVRGERKRAATQAEPEIATKKAKNETIKKSPAVNSKTKSSTAAEAKSIPKKDSDKTSSVASSSTEEAKKKTPVGTKETKSQISSAAKAKPSAKNTSPAVAKAKKSPATKTKTSPVASTSASEKKPTTPTTSRSRNTRSKK